MKGNGKPIRIRQGHIMLGRTWYGCETLGLTF